MVRYVLWKPRSADAAPLRIGALLPTGDVADVTAALQDAGSAAISSMRVFLGLGPAACRAAAERALADPVYHRAAASVNLRAPIYDPCVLRDIVRTRVRASSRAPPPLHNRAFRRAHITSYPTAARLCAQREADLRGHELRRPLQRAGHGSA